MKILLIILVIDSLINWMVLNYMKNDIQHHFLHIIGSSFASTLFTITRLAQIILGLVIIIQLILMI